MLEEADAADRLVDIPDLVGVDGESDVNADRLPGETAATMVIVGAGTHLQLDKTEAGGHGFVAKRDESFVVVPEPPW